MEAERHAANKLFMSLKQQSELPTQLNVIAAIASTTPIISCSSSSASSDSKISSNESEELNKNNHHSPLNKLIMMDMKLTDEN